MENKIGFKVVPLLGFLVIATLKSFSQNYATPLDSALIACYDFSGNANDNSGNGNNGVVNGAVLVNDRNGLANFAYSFNGQNQNIVIPNFSSQVPNSNFAISFWATATVGATRSAFLMSPDDDYNRLNIHIYYVGSTYWDFGNIYSNGRLYSPIGVLPPANTWDHWVFVVSNANGGFRKCYKNGTLIASQIGSSFYSNAQLKDLLIGGGVGVNDSYLWFDGKLDDIRIYRRVLLQNDVTALYTTTTTCYPCATVAAPVNVTPPNSQNICVGQSTSLLAGSSNSVTWYSASNMDLSVGSGTSFATPVLNVGTYTYCAVATSTCGSSETTSFVVNVNPVPVISITGIGNMCSGNAVSLFANTTGSGNIYWSTSPLMNPVIGNGSSFVTPVLSAGIYNYYAVTDAVCSSNIPATTVVSVIPSPTLFVTVDKPVICLGGSTSFNVSGASTYYWDNGSTSPSISVSPTISTTYTVTGSNNGCLSSITVSVEVSNCTGIKDVNDTKGGLTIYPNPNNGEFVVIQNYFSDDKMIEIYDCLNQMINKTELRFVQTVIDLRGRPKGVYLIKVTINGKHRGYSKLVID